MQANKRLKIVFLCLGGLLAASVTANIVLYPLATRPLFEEGERGLIDRTLAAAAAGSRSSVENWKGSHFPIVMRTGNATCVELRATDYMSWYGKCYDRTGQVVSEIEGVVN